MPDASPRTSSRMFFRHRVVTEEVAEKGVLFERQQRVRHLFTLGHLNMDDCRGCFSSPRPLSPSLNQAMPHIRDGRLRPKARSGKEARQQSGLLLKKTLWMNGGDTRLPLCNCRRSACGLLRPEGPLPFPKVRIRRPSSSIRRKLPGVKESGPPMGCHSAFASGSNRVDPRCLTYPVPD